MASWKKIIVSGSIAEFNHISASGDIVPVSDGVSNLGSAGQEFVRQSQQTNEYENDPSYSVDEDGTEWWEDENGQWWYRDPNMDDWDEWNE